MKSDGRPASHGELFELWEALVRECERYALPTDVAPVRMFEMLLTHLEGNHAAVVDALQYRIRIRGAKAGQK